MLTSLLILHANTLPVAWLCGSSGQPYPFGWGAIRRVVRGTVAATLSQQLPVIGAQEGLQDLAVELFLEVSSSIFQRGVGALMRDGLCLRCK